MESKAIEFSQGKIWFDEEQGIIHFAHRPKAVVTIEDSRKYIETVPIFGNKRYPLLVDLRQIKAITKDARSYFANEGSKVVLALALLVSSPLSKIIGNFIISMEHYSIPTRLFTSETEAVDWLKKLVVETHDAHVATDL
ncbi:MAG: hypothetical protein HQM11_16720 [SAR324 cluster bacterium]|nr:hypothetical protein [SAR324 cluster bacterium]